MILAPLLLGAVHLPVVGLLLALSLLACASTLRDTSRATRLPWSAVGFLVMALWAMLQQVPLPQGVVATLTPQAWALHEGAWRALFEQAPQGARALSLDPSASADRAARWLTLAALCFATANAVKGRRERLQLACAVIVGGGLSLVIGGLNLALKLPGFLGLYEAQIPFRGASPFVNLNHAAAHYGLCALVALLVMLDADKPPPWWQPLWSALIAVFTAACMAHESRAVALTLGVSAALGSVTFARQQPQLRRALSGWMARPARARAAFLAGLATLTAALAWRMGVIATFWGWALSEGEGRFLVLEAALRRSADFWLAGAGAGAVRHVLYPALDWSRMHSATIPVVENEWAEWLLCLGWPVSALALMCFALAARALVPLATSQGHLGRRRIAAAALALYTVGIAQAHFPFFALGIGAGLVVLTQAWMIGARAVPRADSPQARPRRAWASFAVVCLVSVSALALARVAPEGLEARVTRTPADERILMSVAREAIAAGDAPRAIRAAQRAVALAPMPHTRLMLASAHGHAGDVDEAIDQFAQVLGTTFKLQQPAWLELMLDTLPGANERARALEQLPEARWARVIHRVRQREGQGAVIDLLAAHVATQPTHASSYELLLRELMASGEAEAAELWAMLMAQQRLDTGDEGRDRADVFLIHALRAQGRLQDAEDALQRALTRAPQARALRAMRLKALPPIDAPIARAQQVEAAHEALCGGPRDESESQACLRGEAWIKERAGAIDEAARLLETLAYRGGDITPLITLMQRQGRCMALRQLAARWDNTGAKRAQAAALKRAGRQCEGASSSPSPPAP